MKKSIIFSEITECHHFKRVQHCFRSIKRITMTRTIGQNNGFSWDMQLKKIRLQCNLSVELPILTQDIVIPWLEKKILIFFCMTMLDLTQVTCLFSIYKNACVDKIMFHIWGDLRNKSWPLANNTTFVKRNSYLLCVYEIPIGSILSILCFSKNESMRL